MKLLLSNDSLTRYANSGAYATTTAIPLEGELGATSAALMGWLQSQLAEGETVGQAFLEPDGTHSDFDEEGNATNTRAKLSLSTGVSFGAFGHQQTPMIVQLFRTSS
jgi:hypothetical protein